MEGASEWSGALGQSWRDQLDGLEATLAPVNRAISTALALEQATRIADIGCGGGGYTQYLAQIAPPDARVTGVDISPDLIETATRRAASRPVDFRCVNAQTDAWEAQRFDRLTSRFGVMFFEDESAAFTNLKSWLAPGGRFAFAVWADYSANPWQGVVRDVARKFVDVAEAAPGQPGPTRYADVERFTHLLERTGFDDVAATVWDGSLKLGGGLPAPEAAKFGLSAFWREELPASSPDRRRAADRLTAILREHEAAGEVSMAARVHIVTGKVLTT